jgi:hypothetical protein
VASKSAESPLSLRHYLAPTVILLLVGWIGVGVIFSQGSIQQQINDQQARAIQKQVEKGRISKAQAEQIQERTEKIAGITAKIGAVVAPAVSAFATPFWWGLVLWLVGRYALKGGFTFMKAVEVAGLASMIAVLDSIVRTLMIVATGNLFANPGPVMLVKEFDSANTTHSILAVFNLMTFWGLAVKSVGLAKLSGVSFVRSAVWVFGLWGAVTALLIGLGVAARSVFGG